MKLKVIALVVAAVFTASSGFAQAWAKAYEAGLRAAKTANWADAKAHFEAAIKQRSVDTDKASQTEGSVADRKPWRNGAAYSPNFGVSYSNFKLAAEATDKQVRADLLAACISGFDALIAKKQESVEALMFLAAALAASNETKRANEIQERMATIDRAKAFHIDKEMLDQADLQTLAGVTTPIGASGGDPRAGSTNTIPVVGVGSRGGLVPALDFKYALLVGVAANGGPQYAEDDLEMVRDALVKHAGYSEDHVVILKGPSSEALMDAARSLSEKVPDSGTILIFYTGRGVQDPRNGKDFLATADTPELFDTDKMVSKLALFQPFITRGASIFSFFQVDRPVDKVGRCFGTEMPQFGRIAQCQANSPGEKAYSTFSNGKPHGVYASAFADVLGEMRNNRIPISDFVWSVFYKIRKGSPDGGGGGAQTPTLPVVVSMATSARF